MTPEKFTEANTEFHPPIGLEESQCQTIHGYVGQIKSGSCDGCDQTVVAYRLSIEEIEWLRRNPVLYLSMIGGLAPHFLSFSFEQATHPA